MECQNSATARINGTQTYVGVVIQSFTEMPHDMELVEQNRRLQRMRRRRQPKRLPYVHHCEPNARALLRAEPGVELAHTRLRTVLAAKPDRPAAKQIAHHNPVGVPICAGATLTTRVLWRKILGRRLKTTLARLRARNKRN